MLILMLIIGKAFGDIYIEHMAYNLGALHYRSKMYILPLVLLGKPIVFGIKIIFGYKNSHVSKVNLFRGTLGS